MITVREAVDMIKLTEKSEKGEFCLAFGGDAIPINEENALFMDAYGDYLVSRVNIYPRSVELELFVLPKKAHKA